MRCIQGRSERTFVALVSLLITLWLCLPTGLAQPVDVSFSIAQQESEIRLRGSAPSFGSAEGRGLAFGSVQTTIDFGDTIFAQDAALQITDSQLSVDRDLSFPISDVATFRIDNPRGEFVPGNVAMNSLPTGLVRFDFPMTAFPFFLNQGEFRPTNLCQNQAAPLADQPVGGTANPDTRGVLTILDYAADTQTVQAQLQLPIEFGDSYDCQDGTAVTFQSTGQVVGYATFQVPEPATSAFVTAMFLAIIIARRAHR